MSSIRDKNLRNLRCRRMLNMIDDQNALNSTRGSSSRGLDTSDTSLDEDFSPDVSEYVPSRTSSPASPLGSYKATTSSHSRQLNKDSIESPNISGLSSLINTPQSTKQTYDNPMASPTAVINSPLPDISNVESFLRCIEQSDKDPKDSTNTVLASCQILDEITNYNVNNTQFETDTVFRDSLSIPSTLFQESELDRENDIQNQNISEISNDNLPQSLDSEQVINNNNNLIAQEHSTPNDETRQPVQQINGTPTQCSRKRQRNESNWIDNKNKKLKNTGKSYMSVRSKKSREERKSRAACTCKRKCMEKIDKTIINNIFKLYWDLASHEKQWEYILRHVSSDSIKRMQLIRKNNRTQTITYKLPCNSDLTNLTIVCKKMFLGTLGITEKVVYTAIEKKNTSIVDLRGTHLNRPRRMSEQTERSIMEHIKEFPVVESHYMRKQSTRLYLSETLNLSKMYRLYKEWFATKSEYGETIMGSKSQYESIFNTKFNLSFFRPKKDMCDQCSIYLNADEARKTELKEDYEKHRQEKETVRELKNMEKANSDSLTQTVACFDLEKVLHLPQSEASIFYYKRKYPVYNFTIYNVLTKKGYCFVWHHQIAKRGAIEISSCLFDYIKKEVENGKKSISFYSDSCTGQNRNRFVFAMYRYASNKLGINITHRFFTKGHSQSEGDMMHSCIEKAKKHHTIYTPDQMYCIISNAKVEGEKFAMKEMQQTDFFDFKSLVNKTRNWLTDENGEKIYWSKIKEIKVEGTSPDVVLFKYNLESESKTLNIARQPSRRRQNTTSQELQLAYTEAFPLPRPLFNDLNSLCITEAIPIHYQEFYKKLLPQTQTTAAAAPENSDDDSSE